MLKALLAPLRWLLRFVFAVLILFEEWGWEPLRRAFALLASLPVIRQLEGLLRRLPPRWALVVLVLPSLLILPIKLLALWLVAEGSVTLGVAVIVAAKLIGTALLAWLFQIIQPALMQLGWFARVHARWTAWKAELLAWVRASAAWRWARAVKLRVKRLFRRGREPSRPL
ncbi:MULTISPECIES: hypothetical protein [unclassified Roseateles]|uniref:hypothetical protein n=1 Tax=unclassified Roseateles TaxID=2626991 RepID=UPI0006FC3A65|nr:MULTISPECIES: hypothetical protein [unclassified Roseateles]KQW45566.1 hypothetical protein ASC81_11735 [Pelomonas sp. Root405]KRA72410.1 hypothetical protein ASD88_11735 [Pelomonas sp. Root662]